MVWTAVLLVSAATGYGLWAFLSGPDIGKFTPIIADLAAGKLGDNGTGIIDLTKSFSGLTPHDQIFLTRRPDGSFIALFPTYYGTGDVIAGLMYTSRPLNGQDTYELPVSVGFDQQLIRVGTCKRLNINRKIDEHWYKVSQGM
jgi:hypothetical protein